MNIARLSFAMSFSLQSFLKRAPASSLQQYFSARQLLADTNIDWSDEGRDLHVNLLNAIREVAQSEREGALADFEEVNQLCDEFGQRALRALADVDLAAFDQLNGPEARGLFMLISHPREYRRALSVAYSERLYNGRTWSRFHVSDREQPSALPNALRQFEDRLKDLFTELDGSGGKMLIESFERPGTTGVLVQYSIFVESAPQTALEFDDDQPRRMTRRPVIEAVLCYDPSEGSIDIVAKGGAPTRKEIGEAFVECFLPAQAELLPVSPRAFDLNRLREPLPFATDPEDGIRQVSVAALRLRNQDEHAGRILVEITDGADIYASTRAWFGNADPLHSSEWRIEQAKLHVMFHPAPHEQRDKKVTIELRMPNGSNLKEQIWRHSLIAGKYLARWGLTRADGA